MAQDRASRVRGIGLRGKELDEVVTEANKGPLGADLVIDVFCLGQKLLDLLFQTPDLRHHSTVTHGLVLRSVGVDLCALAVQAVGRGLLRKDLPNR